MTATKNNEDRLMKMAAKIKETYEPAEIAQLMRLIGATPSTGEMSPEEFERLMKELEAKSNRRGYTEKSIEAARLVLVMGASIAEAAADTELSRQAVNQLMQRIRRRMESLPQGWVQVTDWFPVEVAKQLAKIAETLKAAHAAGKPLNESFTISLKE
ncbi:transcriptional regulator KorA (plasmid) [Pseudomonas fragi]|uniref:transcriptional regulator KorA n=1 Tax=Pseudomonas fragi TaxID=296 RepID=UPI0021C01579|nr:transcriptional regulator KorA [Pseudomonas fragi]UXL41063.1 transcriptional regulator KorA [Pseudomonas fragi]